MNRLELWITFLLGTLLMVASWQKLIPGDFVETLGFVTGGLCVYLVIKQRILNFPIGIANNLFFLVLFSRSRLYGDAGLQIVYMLLAVHGWYWWLRGGENRTRLAVGQATLRQMLLTLGVLLLGTVGMTFLLRAVNGSAPVLDALTTVLSLVAQYLLNCKLVENWYFWIIADAIYIYLYVSRGLTLTAALYFIFLCMCVAGFLNWRRSLADRRLAGADF